MTMTDPIADMLTRIRNATMVYHDRGGSCSKMKPAVAQILKTKAIFVTLHSWKTTSRVSCVFT